MSFPAQAGNLDSRVIRTLLFAVRSSRGQSISGMPRRGNDRY